MQSQKLGNIFNVNKWIYIYNCSWSNTKNASDKDTREVQYKDTTGAVTITIDHQHTCKITNRPAIHQQKLSTLA